jgi:hypothetical protein
MPFQEIKYRARVLRPKKATTKPDFDAETVLCADPRDYADLWLMRKKHDSAREYWLQAREFAGAAEVQPPTSAPLPAYFWFLTHPRYLWTERRYTSTPAEDL